MAFTYGSVFATSVPLNATNMNKCLLGWGPYANFPAPAAYVSPASPGNAGMLAYATDRNMVYSSDGSAWVQTAITPPASLAQGDIIYFNGTAWARLGYGTSGQFLKTQGVGANPVWASLSASQSDVTASRAINGTVYQNTSGKTRFVTISVLNSTTGTSLKDLNVSCGPTSTPSPYVAQTGISDVNFSGVNNWRGTLSFVVPPGYYYKATGTNVFINYWIEWDL